MKIMGNLKKTLFLIPAMVVTIFYGGVALNGIGAIPPVVLVWLALFWAAGILLSKGIFWGGLLGLMPAGYFIYMGMQETGQVISETAVGVIILIYFALCTYCVYRMSQKNKP